MSDVDQEFEQVVAGCQQDYEQADRYWKPDPGTYACQLTDLRKVVWADEEDQKFFRVIPVWKILDDHPTLGGREFSGDGFTNRSPGSMKALRFFVSKLLDRNPQTLIHDIDECKNQVGSLCSVQVVQKGDFRNDRLEAVLEYPA